MQPCSLELEKTNRTSRFKPGKLKLWIAATEYAGWQLTSFTVNVTCWGNLTTRIHFISTPQNIFVPWSITAHHTFHASALSDFRAMTYCFQISVRTHVKFLPASKGLTYGKTSKLVQLLRTGDRDDPSTPSVLLVKKQYAKILRLYLIIGTFNYLGGK